ncbi:MAG: hypothetical protein IKK48_05540, partial [Firmicutes bacterium]|nr:hypothetical protein [Bacillota bacterium]
MKAYYQCTVCNRYSEDQNQEFVSKRRLMIPSLGGHKWADATCAAPKTCTVCKTTEGVKLDTHETNIVKYDNDRHWKVCACGKTSSASASHVWNVGKVTKTATTSANGTMTYTCKNCIKTKTQSIPKIASVTLSTTKYTYTGYSKTPTVTVKDAKGNILKKDTDYTVTYPSSRWDVGRYKVTIKMKGSYLSTFYRYYTIVPKAPSSASAYLTSYYGQYTGYDDVRFTWSKARG